MVLDILLLIFRVLLVIAVCIPLGLLIMKLMERLMQDYRDSAPAERQHSRGGRGSAGRTRR